jgi:hypothetical protein
LPGTLEEGQRDKRAVEEVQAAAGTAVKVIDVSEQKLALNRVRRALVHGPRRIPSAKWRELIKKVWLVLRREGSLR